MKCYNLCKVLACSTVFFQLSVSHATFFQLRTFILLISSKMSSSQHVLGLPIGLLDMGFHLLTFWTLLSLTMCSTWPNQFNLNSLIMNGYCSHISFLLLNTKLLFFKFCVIYLYDDDVLGSVVRSQ